MRRGRSFATATLAVALLAASCSPAGDAAQPGRTSRDSDPDGLFRDFLDGKYDGAGHPLGATVFEAEAACGPAGVREAEGWAAHAGAAAAGVLCRATTPALGTGSFVFNVRALSHAPGTDGAATALTLTVRDAAGAALATQVVPASAFPAPLLFRNLSVRYTQAAAGPVTLEVDWSGAIPVRLDYLEVFHPERQLVVGPPSGVLGADAALTLELVDPPAYASLQARCGATDLSPTLAALLADGTATQETTDFRTTVTAPAAALLASCVLPARVTVQALAGTAVKATSRVSYLDAPPACAFAPGALPVLLTGFEPFPADSTADNSAERAVRGFDSSALTDVSVMPLIIPVEYDSAPAWVLDVIRRCRPEVVISFGQGRWAVDVETTAYNRKDTTDVAGGVPDNRGVVQSGEPIDPDGPAELPTGLPVAPILARLETAGIDAGASDDPGRYICNDVFYSELRELADTAAVAGFVHLPYMARVDEEAQARLQIVVESVVREAVALRRGR
ncbi:MAG TPA: pyroglutamyl-peptidase I [Polyangia bacterium]|jgi:pyroglutamyl-peptidase